MIAGIGIDIIGIARIKKLLDRKGFIEKVFSAAERKACERFMNPVVSLAGRFAAKEAVMKALGTGWAKGIAWTDISITNDETGKPIVTLEGEAKRKAEAIGTARILVSISHTDEFAVAQAVAEGGHNTH